jgi:RNA polymerase sigma-70 factor (ECF subfamily)
MEAVGHRGRQGPGATLVTVQAEDFERHRSLLFSIAYRMLGSVAEAEDVVQEAYLRWRVVSEEEVRSPRSYLSAVVTRLSINRLRSAQARREEYVGPWLPEPLLSDGAEEIAGPSELDESLSMAFLVLLESLNPVERAVFLLREVFDYDYEEISRIVGKSEANCRQIAHRARQSVAARRPRFERSPEQEERLTRQFVETCTSGDMEGLVSLLSEDVTLWSDGGGKVAAAPYPIHGPERVARFLVGVLRTVPRGFFARPIRVNGGPGVVGYVDGQPTGVVALEVADGRLRSVRIVVNPDKLRAISTSSPSQ